MFIPLMKADAAQRLVYGSIDETPDRAGEIFDYATGKAAFEDWSKTQFEASGGKSYGNIRAQHDLKKAAGKLVEITFDDEAKRISFCGKIVDDAEWTKVEEGVYTGYSPGGSYAKRWDDGAYKRYTPRVGELSIVDVPCIKTATFTLVKADGSEADVAFVIGDAYEPGNDATKARATELAKAAGKEDRVNDYVVQARADLIAENAEAELAKMASEAVVEPRQAAEPSAADRLSSALAKADTALASDPAAAIDLPAPFTDFAAVAAALRLFKSDRPELAKGLYTVEWLSRLMEEFACLQGCLYREAKHEQDGSELPAKAAEIVKQIGVLLAELAQEEIAEALAQLDGEETILVVETDTSEMLLANQIVDLVKADTALMEKAGARNSKTDAAKIQSMHDNAVALGATCDGDAEKVANLTTENERLNKAVGDAVPMIDSLTEAVTALKLEKANLASEVDRLKAEPAPPKGSVFEVPKADDANLGKAADDSSEKPKTFTERLAEIPPGPKRAQFLLKNLH